MRSFVFGNGKSRLNITFDQVKPYGKIYACNAVYREYSPDYLIAVDPKMIVEIEASKYQLEHEVWTNPNSRYKDFTGFNIFNNSLGWSSGPTALHLATQHKADEIYIFGFDYESPTGLINNVYANTPNYKKSEEPATFYGNWTRQTETVIKENKTTKYFRIVENKYYDPQWHYPNFRHVTYDKLREDMLSWNKNA